MKTDTASLLSLLSKLIPLVDSLADKLRFMLILLGGLIVWFVVDLVFLKHWHWGYAATTALIILIPLAILARAYWSLRDIQNLPNMLDEVSDDLRATWADVSSGKRNALNIAQQAKKLWEVKGLLGSADDVIGQYVSFGVLVNPFFLILVVIALICSLFLLLTGGVTLLAAVF